MSLFPTYAHIGYLLSPQEMTEKTGFDGQFFRSVFVDFDNILLMLATIIVCLLAYILLPRTHFVKKQPGQIIKKLTSYSDLISWMARLSLGIMLIGAGTNNLLISQILPNYPQLAFMQILIGFLFLAGLFLTPISLTLMALYLFALSRNLYVLGNLELVGLALLILVDHNPKPGIDDIFNVPGLSFLKNFKKYIPLLIRLTLGGAMFYLAIFEKFFHPYATSLVVERFGLTEAIPVSSAMWVFSAGLIESIIAICLILGFKTRLVSAIAFLVVSISFFYFKESVAGHVTLFGSLSILFTLGGGKFSLDQRAEA